MFLTLFCMKIEHRHHKRRSAILQVLFKEAHGACELFHEAREHSCEMRKQWHLRVIVHMNCQSLHCS